MVSKYDEWTVQELKEALKERKLPVSGKKRELIERLLSGDDEEGTEFELFIRRARDTILLFIIAMILPTLVISFLVAGNPDQIEGFGSGASGVAIDDDNFVYVTQQDTFVKYSVIEDDDGTLSLKEEYASGFLSGGDLKHLFIEGNYVYAVTTQPEEDCWHCESTIHKIEDSGQDFITRTQTRISGYSYGVSGIVVSGDYTYVSVSGERDLIYMYYNLTNIGKIHSRPDDLGHSDDIYGDGYIKGLATNDENLYALVHSCLKPDSNEYAGLGILCKDYIYVWKLDTLMSLAEEGLSGANIPIDTSMSLGVFHWHSSISANGDYVYLGDDAWGTGIVVVDFSDYNNPKKVHSYGRTIDQYPSGEVKGSGIATNDDFIVVSTAGKPIFQGDIIGYGDGDDGVYVGKIDGDDDDVPLGKDAFPDWKYINSKWDLYAFLVLILGLPSSIHEGWSKIAFQRVRKAEDRAEAELHITKLKDTIDKLKSKGIETANLEKVLAQCEAEMEFATSFSFRKAGKMAQKSLTEAKGLKSEHKTIGKKIDIIKEKIMEFKEKGINTEELEKVLEKTETT